jgi:hypothetical protein
MSINPMQRAGAAPRCTAKSKRTGKRCRAPAVTRLESLPDTWGPWRRPKRRAQRKLPAWCPLKEDNRALEVHQITTLTNVCFRRQSRHELVRCTCLLLTQSGHTLGRVPSGSGKRRSVRSLAVCIRCLGPSRKISHRECMGGSI